MIPTLRAVYGKYHGSGLEIIGYASEQAQGVARLAPFTQSNGMMWREVWDKKGSINTACGWAGGLPATIVIGRDGRIAAVRHVGEGFDLEAAAIAALAKP